MPINSLESSGLQSVTDSWPRLRQSMDGPAQSCGTHCTRLSLSRQSNRKQKTTTRCRRVWSDLLALCDERVMLESIYMRSLRIWSVEKNLWETMSTGLHRITVCSLTFQFHWIIFLGSLLEGCDLPGSVWPSQRNGAGGQNAWNLVI